MGSTNKLKYKRSLSSRLSEKASDFQLCNKIFKQSHSATILHAGDTSNTNKSHDITPRLDYSFFNQPCTSLAKSLLGKILVRKLDSGELLKGKIVETESYLGGIDKASHSYQGKRTERTEAMYLPPGTAYVYSVYGMYHCFNISSLEDGSAVLIRALEPIQNIPTMLELRTLKSKGISSIKDRDICNGPSKLCQAFHIDKSFNKLDMCSSDVFYIEDGASIGDCDIVSCKRIGIESAGEEWANKPLRFYFKGCSWVSIRNKLAEKSCANSHCTET